MITTILIIVYIISIIGAYFTLRRYMTDDANWWDIFLTFCPLANLFVIILLSDLLDKLEDFPNWFFKLPKR